MKNLAICASLLAAVSLAACGDTSGELTVINDSDYVIEELYLTDVGNSVWGPDLLRGDVLFPDEELTVRAECGYYDALLVDEEGVTCELHDLDLCLNDATWYIRNNTCVAFEAALKARQAAAEAAAKDAATK
jgi:hypothetical protein